MASVPDPPLTADARRRVARAIVRLRRVTIEVDGELAAAVGAELTSNAVVGVLHRLAERGPARPRDLAGEVRLTTGGLSKVLDRLSALGLVERRAGDGVGDGRAVVVRLTPRGRRQHRRIVHAIAAGLHRAAPSIEAFAAEVAPLGAGQLPDATLGCVGGLAQIGVLLGAAAERSRSLDVASIVVLAVVEEDGLARPRQLCALLGFTSGGMTKLVDRLVDAGLVERAFGVVADDHRAVVISGTDAGRAVLDRYAAAVAPLLPAVAHLLRAAHEEALALVG